MSARVCGAFSQVMQSEQRSSTITTSEPLASQRSGCRKVDPQRGHIVIAATARSYGARRTELAAARGTLAAPRPRLNVTAADNPSGDYGVVVVSVNVSVFE